MAWTTPKTDWETGELVAASDMNAIGENLAALDTVRETVAFHTTTEQIEINAVDFSDVDSDNLNLSITTDGSDVLVHFHGSVYLGTSKSSSFDVDVDGTRQGGDEGIGRIRAGTWQTAVVSFTRLIQGLSAGSHTFKLKCKAARGAINLEAGAQFWVREI